MPPPLLLYNKMARQEPQPEPRTQIPEHRAQDLCLPKDIAVHIEKQRRQPCSGRVEHNIRLGQAYFVPRTWTCLPLSNYATPSPVRVCVCVGVCGIIVSGRTCILMEMDSTAINISKYIYNGFALVRFWIGAVSGCT